MKIWRCHCEQCVLSRQNDRDRRFFRATFKAKRTYERMRVKYALKNGKEIILPALISGYTDLRKLKPSYYV